MPQTSFFNAAAAHRRFFSVVMLIVALLAGCGGGGSGETIATKPVPTLDIRSDISGEARTPFTVSFYFSEAVTIPNGQLAFKLTGASVVAGSFKQVNARTYSVQLSPNANAQGLVDLLVPAGAYQDSVTGLSSTVAYEFSQPFNTQLPFSTLTFTGPTNPLGMITGSGSFQLVFNGVLDADLVATKLLVSTGSISGFSKTSAAGQAHAYRFTYTPPTATSGGLTIELPKAAVTMGGLGNDLNWWTFGLTTP